MTRFGTLHACHAAKPGKPRLRPIAECSPRRGRRAHRCQLLDDEQRGQPVAIAGMQVQPVHHFQAAIHDGQRRLVIGRRRQQRYAAHEKRVGIALLQDQVPPTIGRLGLQGPSGGERHEAIVVC